MQRTQQYDGTPIIAMSKDVTITDTPKTLATLLALSIKDQEILYAYVYISAGVASMSTRVACPQANGIAVEQGTMIRLNGYPEIARYYFRTYTTGDTVTAAVEIERR